MYKWFSDIKYNNICIYKRNSQSIRYFYHEKIGGIHKYRQ